MKILIHFLFTSTFFLFIFHSSFAQDFIKPWHIQPHRKLYIGARAGFYQQRYSWTDTGNNLVQKNANPYPGGHGFFVGYYFHKKTSVEIGRYYQNFLFINNYSLNPNAYGSSGGSGFFSTTIYNLRSNRIILQAKPISLQGFVGLNWHFADTQAGEVRKQQNGVLEKGMTVISSTTDVYMLADNFITPEVGLQVNYHIFDNRFILFFFTNYAWGFTDIFVAKGSYTNSYKPNQTYFTNITFSGNSMQYGFGLRYNFNIW